MSAFSVVMPRASAFSEKISKPTSISVSDLTTVVGERWIMVTAAPLSQRSTATSCPELAAPMTATRLPRNVSPLKYWLECRISPWNAAAPGRSICRGGP
jgi:hypothetical protein